MAISANMFCDDWVMEQANKAPKSVCVYGYNEMLQSSSYYKDITFENFSHLLKAHFQSHNGPRGRSGGREKVWERAKTKISKMFLPFSEFFFTLGGHAAYPRSQSRPRITQQPASPRLPSLFLPPVSLPVPNPRTRGTRHRRHRLLRRAVVE